MIALAFVAVYALLAIAAGIHLIGRLYGWLARRAQ